MNMESFENQRTTLMGERTSDGRLSVFKQVPDATVARFPTYLWALGGLRRSGIHTASSEELADAAGVNAATLRKDLSYLGTFGTRGVGYETETLIERISMALGLSSKRDIVIVGVGNLGHALCEYEGFAEHGFNIVGIFDSDPNKIGQRIGNTVIQPTTELERVVKENDVSIAVITTPAVAAQAVSDQLVAMGVTSLLNFASCVLQVPPNVDVRNVDLSTELQILAFHIARKAALN